MAGREGIQGPVIDIRCRRKHDMLHLMAGDHVIKLFVLSPELRIVEMQTTFPGVKNDSMWFFDGALGVGMMDREFFREGLVVEGMGIRLICHKVPWVSLAIRKAAVVGDKYYYDVFGY